MSRPRPPLTLRESLGYLNWLANPFARLDVAAVYDLIASRAPTERGLWLNLGYWRDARTLDDACEALAALVAETGGMGPGDRVLDVGYGLGEQDLLWAARYRPDSIVGLNITPGQVRVARARVAEAGLAGRIDLRLGSATAMPLEAGSFDLVVALECAFHFVTREAFFREAMRVLAPGGRLVTADIIPAPPKHGTRPSRSQRLSWGLVASKFPIPEANAYGRDGYRQRLAGAGFTAIRVESIREQVYGPLHRHIQADPAPIRRLHPLARPILYLSLLLDPERVYSGLDYVLVSARKP